MEKFGGKLPEPHFCNLKMNFLADEAGQFNFGVKRIKIRKCAEKLQIVSYCPCDHY